MTIQISKQVLEKIRKSISNTEKEAGGIIGMNSSGIITAFFLDVLPLEATYTSYTPNVNVLNQVINEEWMNCSIDFVGFVHSHPHSDTPSDTDLAYMRKIRETIHAEGLFCGVFNSLKCPDSEYYGKWCYVMEKTIVNACVELV